MATKKTGRPSKFTAETRGKILEALRAGNFREVAAQYAGVARSTFCHWMQSAEPEFVAFREEVERAEQAAEVRAVALVMSAAAQDPKHAQWWLERKFPDRWGRKDRHEIKSENTTTVAGGVTVFLPAEDDARPERVETEPGTANAVPRE